VDAICQREWNSPVSGIQGNEAYATRFERGDDGIGWKRYSSIIRAPINPRVQPFIGEYLHSSDLILARDARYVLAYGIRRSRGGLISFDEDLSAEKIFLH